MKQPQGPRSKGEPNTKSPSWQQGYKDGWDKKPCTNPDDVSYMDGYQVGDAERDGGVDREGRYPIKAWLDEGLAPLPEVYPEYYKPPDNRNKNSSSIDRLFGDKAAENQ
jgi:hypothetical protein